jgi:hypothetical protein
MLCTVVPELVCMHAHLSCVPPLETVPAFCTFAGSSLFYALAACNSYESPWLCSYNALELVPNEDHVTITVYLTMFFLEPRKYVSSLIDDLTRLRFTE